MKKTLIIVIVVLLVAGVALVGWFASKNQASSIPVSGPSVPTEASSSVVSSTSVSQPTVSWPTGDTIDIGTPLGTVTVKNVYNTILGWEDAYLIFQQTSTYELLYDTVDSSFVVSINKGPLATTRPEAEAALLSSLGISQADACKLSVIVGVDPSVDSSLAGEALPLSFCVAGTFGQ
jgi:hypothetical protein